MSADEKAVGVLVRPWLGDWLAGLVQERTERELRQVLRGLLRYEQKNGRFPPPFSQGKDGRPLLSWLLHHGRSVRSRH